jgi:hypothetical protein
VALVVVVVLPAAPLQPCRDPAPPGSGTAGLVARRRRAAAFVAVALVVAPAERTVSLVVLEERKAEKEKRMVVPLSIM